VTIDEIEDTLPNGFHDTQIAAIQLDYERSSCVLTVDVDLEEREARMELILTGLFYCIPGPPDPAYSFAPDGSPERASGCETTEDILPTLKPLRNKTPDGAFFYSFFLNSWNSFIHVAAMDAQLRWLEH
jgi:hypothetical protein